MLDKVFEKIRNNKLVSSGLEVYQIAKEVYTLVNTSESAETTAEDIYLTASIKVTSKTPETII